MSKTKKDYLNDLVKISFEIDEKTALLEEKTKNLQRMAVLSRQGLKYSDEFKKLEASSKKPIVTDLSNDIKELRNVVKQLKHYKWED